MCTPIAKRCAAYLYSYIVMYAELLELGIHLMYTIKLEVRMKEMIRTSTSTSSTTTTTTRLERGLEDTCE